MFRILLLSGGFASFIVLCLTVCAMVFYQNYSKRKNYHSIVTRIPTVYGLPLLGIAYQIFPVKKFLYVLESYFEKFNRWTYCAWIGIDPFLITADLEVIKFILSSDAFLNKANKLYTPIDYAIPHGIITSPVTKWRHNRKLVASTFSHKIVSRYIPIFERGTQMAVEKLDALASTGEHPIFTILKNTFLKMAFETTMGVVVQEKTAAHEEIVDGFNFMIEQIAKDSMLGTLKLGFLTHTPKYHRTKRFIRQYVEQLIKINCGSKLNNNKSGESSTENSKSQSFFLQQAISFQNAGLFDLDDVVSETETVIAGSFETVSTQIYSILIMLAMHPCVQEKLYEEIINVTSRQNTSLDYEQLKQFPYMGMVIEETLRLMPSIPLIGREALETTQLPDGTKLPQGMQVLISIFSLHRRKDLWGPDAHLFNPDNFLPERVNDRHPFAYIPFSKGARNCIGWRYANMVLRVMLIGLLRNFKFSTSFKYENLVFLDHISLRYLEEPLLQMDRRRESAGSVS